MEFHYDDDITIEEEDVVENDSWKELILRCECSSPDHTVFLDHDKEHDDFFFTFHLRTDRGFLKRLWYGLKYAFGYQSRYGAWDEVIIRKNDCIKIKSFLG